MAGEFAEFFNELLFGTGAYLGAILICAIVLLVTYKVRYSGALFMPITIFLGIQYLNTVPQNSNLIWVGILMFIMSIYSLGTLINGVVRHG